MTRRERIEARVGLLTEPARTRVQAALSEIDKGMVRPDGVADLVRDRRSLQTIAIEIANYVAELKLAGSVEIDGPNAQSAPGGLGLWWGWVAQVYPDETTTTLTLAEREQVFDLQWRPANEDSRQSDDMKQAVSLLRTELGSWLGRPVRLFELFT